MIGLILSPTQGALLLHHRRGTITAVRAILHRRALARKHPAESLVMRGIKQKGEPDEARSVEAVAESFADHYPRYQYALVEFLVAHLADIARAFDGDLQQPLILAVIGQVRIRPRRQAEKAGDPSPPPSELAITASRLADVTGIPRETVRRKLKLLEARGWIARRPDGAFYLVADASGDDVPARRHFEEQDKRTRR